MCGNVMLNELDKELESRGHKYVRYADDCLILCKSRKSAERTMENIVPFITGKHSFHMKRNALRIPQSGNQERIIAYFLENDGQYIRDLAIRSLSEHFIVIILQYTHLNLILLNWMITSGVGRRMKLVTLKSP